MRSVTEENCTKSSKEGPRNLLSVGQYPEARGVQTKYVKSSSLPLHFKPGISGSVRCFFFWLQWLLTLTTMARMQCYVSMVHYLWTRLEPISRHLIVDKGLLYEEALLSIRKMLYSKMYSLYFNTCLLRKKLFQALTYMVLN